MSASVQYNSHRDSGDAALREEKEDDDVHPIIRLYREVKSGRQRLGPVVAFSLIAVVGACLNGFMLGFTAVLEINMRKNAYPVESSQNMKFIGSIATIGALIAGIITGFVSDKLGRKMSFLLASVPYIVGFLFIVMSYTAISKSVISTEGNTLYLVFFLIGRALSGFGAGAMSLIVPVYVIEISPDSLKGLFGSLNQLAITIGILLIYLMNTFIPYYISALIVMGVTFAFGVCVWLVLPESPRWLAVNGKYGDAQSVLIVLRGKNGGAAEEIKRLRENLDSEDEYTFWHRLNMFRKRSVFVPMILSVALMFFQQFCGINVVIFYAGSVLQSADVSNPDLKADLGVGVIQVIFTLVSVFLVDILGRKILLSIGGILLALSTGVLGMYFFLHDHDCHGKISSVHTYCEAHFGYLAVACLAVFIIGFSIGWGPIPWVMMTELAPLQVRGIMSGVAIAVNWTFAAIITSTVTLYEKEVQTYGAWWTFCAICILSVIFTIIFLPETKGKNLEDIQEYFKKDYFRKLFVCWQRSGNDEERPILR